MSRHEAPLESHRRHWYANVGPVPLHPPAVPVSVCPWLGVPLIVGTVTFAGTTIVPTNLTRLFCSSAIRTSPLAVRPTAFGMLTCAAVAAPPSPEKPATPVPANVEM